MNILKNVLAVSIAAAALAVSAQDVLIKNGIKAWLDRSYIINELPESLVLTAPVPAQYCGSYSIKFPANTQRALIGLCDNQGVNVLQKTYKLQAYPGEFYIGNAAKPRLLKYKLWIIENPPPVLKCSSTRAGAVLLALDGNVPAAPASAADSAAKPVKNRTDIPEFFNELQTVPGQEYRFIPGARKFEYYVRIPRAGVNENTGLMLLSHNWGGTWKLTAPWCDLLADRFNLICLSVNYLQSGPYKRKVPYDHGLLQAMDCLRALYDVQQKLTAAKLPYNRRRIYAGGASGGGNVSLMVNKLAPNTFACTVDLCGMPGLTDEIAYGIGRLNAGYSRDPKAANYLSPAMQEIRDPGNMVHLKLQKKFNPDNQVVIVHGLDDTSCNPADKMVIASNMVRAGFRPATHFLTADDVDGVIVRNTGHSIGNRPEVIAKFAGVYIGENGKSAKILAKPSDFEAQHEIVYPVTGGRYIVSFKGMPSIRFEKQP